MHHFVVKTYCMKDESICNILSRKRNGCMNKNSTRAMAVDILTWEEKISVYSHTQTKNQRQQMTAGKKVTNLCQGQSIIGYLMQCKALNHVYTNNEHELKGCVYIFVHTDTYIV